jgi:hypothetical protein
MKRMTKQQSGTLFLLGLCTFVWTAISISNNNGLIESIIGGIFLGAISTIVLVILYAFLQGVYKW